MLLGKYPPPFPLPGGGRGGLAKRTLPSKEESEGFIPLPPLLRGLRPGGAKRFPPRPRHRLMAGDGVSND